MAALGSSVSQFVSALIPNLVIFAVFILLFVYFRKRQRRVYEPRVVVETVPNDIRPDETPRGAFSWISYVLGKSERFIIQQAGADGYFFIRYLYIFGSVCLLGCFMLWPILFPVNATNSAYNNDGFDILAYGNVSNKWRFFAHVFLSWLFFGSIVFIIYRELVYYTTFRHALQSTPLYDSLLSSRTLLLTETPENLLKETELRNYFPTATNVWYARDYKELREKVKERTKLSAKYEGTVNKVITKAVQLRNKCVKKGKETPSPADDLNKYLKDGKKRPTHKLKFLIGKKVDTLDYCVERLGELNADIKTAQEQHNANTQIPSVFIEFPTQIELQKAYQAIPYNDELKCCQRYTGVAPDDIVWDNLSLTKNKRRTKKVLACTVLTLTIIFWAIPVAVVGCISNINFLTEKVPFLRFINNMPPKLMGIITGLLPVVALAVLMSLVPPFIKKMGKVSGLITLQEVERFCQNWYYAFIAVNSFFVITVISSAVSVVSVIILDPSKALSLLAKNVPKASNFYIANACLQGLTISSGMLLQIVALILAQFLGRILDKTPRAKWNRWNTLGQPFWSVTYPSYQFISLISVIYSMISPLILGFNFIAMVLSYIAFVYNLVYVMIPNKIDGRGRGYALTLFQLFVAVYLGEVCLIALFVFGKNWACVALEAVCLAATAASHIYFKYKFLSLWDAVPISALRYAAGDSTYQYPMHDQGKKEIQIEGQNYWNGGNQLGLNENNHEQVLPQSQFADEKTGYSDEKALNDETDESNRGLTSKNDLDKSTNDKAMTDKSSTEVTEPNVSVKPMSWLKRFFTPKSETFDMIRDIMPSTYFNYIEYNPEFVKNAYEDPAVNDEEPHIWIARDDLGLSEIEKNKALQNGVDACDDNAIYNDKGKVEYNGPPPSYEESLKV